MGPLGRIRARMNAPSIRVLREAGPPVRWLVLAAVFGVLVVIALYLAGIRDSAVLIAVPWLAFVITCASDRDGWRIRMAIAELAARQRERWVSGALPVDPVSAESWLTRHPDAPVLERASVMATADRPADGLALLEGATAESPEEEVRLERLRLTLEGSVASDPDAAGALSTFEALPALSAVSPDEARFHRLSLAWSFAWQAIHQRRPWRTAFARSIRPLAPFAPPLRLRLLHAIQHYAFPIAYALAWLIVLALDLDGRTG